MNNDKQKEFTLQIQLVDNIDDSEIKRKYLLTLQDLHKDIKDIKKRLQRFTQRTKKQSINLKNTKKQLKNFRQRTKKQIIHSKHVLQKQSSSSSSKEVEPIKPDIQEEKFINLIERITYQNWNININITIQDSFKLQTIALIDSGAQINCIQEELIPTKFFEKTEQKLSTANGESLRVKFKISDVHICNGGIYIKQSFILVKDNLGIGIILSQPFLEIIKPFKVTNEGITTKLFQQKILFTFNEKPITKEVNLLKTLSIFEEHSINLIKDLSNKKFEQQLLASQIKEKINLLRNNIIKKFCSDLPDVFWHRK
ncbi:RVP domain-containing protein [Cephalotus follicularis]|uniref:RVP domain-containing protein n=1 Tax=Cephalotus follicularis TaxID=3775 RepID=A0A1Q3DJ52_CEPFO|nr:RVP domain-containing protein [Cephalotus follicularis]